MASKLFFLVSILWSCTVVWGTEHVPVLMWKSGDSGKKEITSPSVLSKLSSDDFSDYITKNFLPHKSKTKPLVVVFLEENLSTEDFILMATQHSQFSHLGNVTSQAEVKSYLPSVDTPLKALKTFGYQWQTYHSSDEPVIPKSGGVVLVVKLGDAKGEETRPDLLRRHDSRISDIYNQVAAVNRNTVAMYTARHSSWVEPEGEVPVRRVLLAAEEEITELKPTETNETFWHDDENVVFIYTTAYPTLTNDSGEPSTVTLHNITPFLDNRADKNLQRLVVKYKDITLRFRFQLLETQYWSLSEVEYEMDNKTLLLTTTSDITAPVGFSYHCGSSVVFKNDSLTLNFTNLQAQPFLKVPKFGDSYDCVWFFTVPIWSGIFVTAILVCIMIWGLTMILDIKTMDQFDDPKGKTITINASE